MAIRIEQPGLAGLYGKAAVISKQEAEARRIQEQQARKEEQQAEFEYRTALRQQDMAIDLEMNQRAKLWEIEKAEIASRADFMRKEQVRQRKLDSADNAIQQIDKEVLAGRMTEQEAYPLKLKYELNKLDVDAPTPLLPTGGEEDKYGVRPYWMKGRDAPEGTPERQLYEAKMAEQISEERGGTIPYYLSPKWLRETDRDVVEQVLASREIFFDTPEDLDAFINRQTTQLPLDDKQLDVGVRAEEGIEPVGEDRVRVVSPNGETGSILRGEIPEYRAAGFEILDEALPTTEPVEEDIMEQLEAGEAKFYKPSLKTFLTMSPLRALMERRKAKKLVR